MNSQNVALSLPLRARIVAKPQSPGSQPAQTKGQKHVKPKKIQRVPTRQSYLDPCQTNQRHKPPQRMLCGPRKRQVGFCPGPSRPFPQPQLVLDKAFELRTKKVPDTNCRIKKQAFPSTRQPPGKGHVLGRREIGWKSSVALEDIAFKRNVARGQKTYVSLRKTWQLLAKLQQVTAPSDWIQRQTIEDSSTHSDTALVAMSVQDFIHPARFNFTIGVREG